MESEMFHDMPLKSNTIGLLREGKESQISVEDRRVNLVK